MQRICHWRTNSQYVIAIFWLAFPIFVTCYGRLPPSYSKPQIISQERRLTRKERMWSFISSLIKSYLKNWFDDEVINSFTSSQNFIAIPLVTESISNCRTVSHHTSSHKHFHTRSPSHKDSFTHRQFNIRTSPHRDTFTCTSFTWLFSHISEINQSTLKPISFLSISGMDLDVSET